MSPLGGDRDAPGAAVSVSVSRVNGCECSFFLLFSFYIHTEQEGGKPCVRVEELGRVGATNRKKQCSSLNKQPSLKYLISCIFNEPILKTCGLILGTLGPERRAIFRLPPLTVSGAART